MTHIESLQAILERRLIRQMVASLEEAPSREQRERHLGTLRDLVLHADTTLDARLFDEWTEARLRDCGLWVWDRTRDAGNAGDADGTGDTVIRPQMSRP